jgi:hypothetical protein
VRVDIDNCRVLERGCFLVAATIRRATAKSLVEGQAVLGRHNIVKHRVHCAGEVVQTSYNILTDICNSGYLKQVMHPSYYCIHLVIWNTQFCTWNLHIFPPIGIWESESTHISELITYLIKRFSDLHLSTNPKLCYKTFLHIIYFKAVFQNY